MSLWVGIGCQKGVTEKIITAGIEQLLTEYQLDVGAIAGIATIDSKSKEPGLVGFCQLRGWILRTFPPEILNSLTVPHPSLFVGKQVGTNSVAEASALSAVWELSPNIPLGELNKHLVVSKQVFHSPYPEEKGCLTLAVAREKLQ
ncbi:cobalamin biosynthesis protein [Calothrix sp. 336/3]|uniref:cobalamin biosynthesis protein n=1 Tax=Calothrix sp. 336/3 TaxID=1337936 RepID=UPI0004E2FD5B|nr:cobalamin biosynthesis protein [Calothrix sp. 336/3]AKG23168.1 hypothetical protein IJ00_19505 [Calothrix sp. 336/3]